MRRILALSAALALLLLLTLGPKLATRSALADGPRLARDIAAGLERDGFTVRILHHQLFDYVDAQRGGCRILAGHTPPAGYLRDRFQRAAANIGQVRYLYGANPPGGFPRFLPVLTDQFQRRAFTLGWIVPVTPIIGVAASPDCAIRPAGWARLRLWPTAGA